jgi:hypothetical protein
MNFRIMQGHFFVAFFVEHYSDNYKKNLINTKSLIPFLRVGESHKNTWV